MGQSEIARLRERIEQEYQACRSVFTEFTPTARHEYITVRQQRIEACYQELKTELGSEAAMSIIIQAEQAVYGGASSSGSTS